MWGAGCSRTRRLVPLVIVAACALAGACGGGSDDAPATATATASLPPISIGTPDSPDPSNLAPPEAGIAFEIGALESPELALAEPTSLAFGPDGRLYVAQVDGRIVALTLDGRAVVEVEEIVAAGMLGNVLGVAFNPLDPPEPVTLYASYTLLYAGVDGPAYPGGVARLTAPEFAPERIVTGLPVSAEEHGTNGIAFDGAGRLYVAQGGTTNAGIPSERHSRSETPLTSAILVADVAAPTFDGAIVHDPSDTTSDAATQTAGDVDIHASGLRNPYDLVFHSNGRLYATDNGPNEPAGNMSTGCASSEPGRSAPDELNVVFQGGYYGHPNRNRGRDDERQCVYRGADDASGGVPPIATLGTFVSANGLAEYTGDAFGGRMRGDLIYAAWNDGRVWRVVLAADGLRVESISPLAPGGLDRPLDVTVAPDGVIYVAEMGGGRIVYFAPAEDVTPAPAGSATPRPVAAETPAPATPAPQS